MKSVDKCVDFIVWFTISLAWIEYDLELTDLIESILSQEYRFILRDANQRVVTSKPFKLLFFLLSEECCKVVLEVGFITIRRFKCLILMNAEILEFKLNRHFGVTF